MPSILSRFGDVRPTARGIATLAIALAAVALAWLFGERALNAVAAPALLGLLAAAVQLGLARPPTVERTVPGPDFQGTAHEIHLDVEGGTTILGVSDELPEKLSDTDFERSVSPPRTLTYDIEYHARGVHTVGPTRVRETDVFGLLARTSTVEDTDELLVYPAVYDLRETDALSSLLAQSRTPERQEFDDLREYVPGDPLRDIHWKSSAKRGDGDLIVKEFAGREPQGSIAVAASAASGDADLMASAVASIALAILDAGLRVDLLLAGRTLRVGGEHTDRAALLETLARVEAGNADQSDWEDADVTVSAANGSATVGVGDHRAEFDTWRAAPLRDLSGGPERGAIGGEVRA